MNGVVSNGDIDEPTLLRGRRRRRCGRDTHRQDRRRRDCRNAVPGTAHGRERRAHIEPPSHVRASSADARTSSPLVRLNPKSRTFPLAGSIPVAHGNKRGIGAPWRYTVTSLTTPATSAGAPLDVRPLDWPSTYSWRGSVSSATSRASRSSFRTRAQSVWVSTTVSTSATSCPGRTKNWAGSLRTRS